MFVMARPIVCACLGADNSWNDPDNNRIMLLCASLSMSLSQIYLRFSWLSLSAAILAQGLLLFPDTPPERELASSS